MSTYQRECRTRQMSRFTPPLPLRTPVCRQLVLGLDERDTILDTQHQPLFSIGKRVSCPSCEKAVSYSKTEYAELSRLSSCGQQKTIAISVNHAIRMNARKRPTQLFQDLKDCRRLYGIFECDNRSGVEPAIERRSKRRERLHKLTCQAFAWCQPYCRYDCLIELTVRDFQ